MRAAVGATDSGSGAGNLEDRERLLLQGVLRKDAASLGALLQRWRPWLLGRAKRDLGRNRPGGLGPSDCVQETCVLALRSIADFQGGTLPQLRGWLACILHNAVRDAGRKGRAGIRSEQRTGPLDGDVASPARSLSQQVSTRQRYRMVVAELRHLPPRQRNALYLRLLEERSLSEIAAQLELSEQAAASLIKNGLAALRLRLQPEAPKVKRGSAVALDAAILAYLRLCDRGQEPARDEFLRLHPECAQALAPILDWLHEVRARLAEA